MVTQFNPKLVIEATRVCDRNCHGCYAPNLKIEKNPFNNDYKDSPHLSPEQLYSVLSEMELENKLESISIRGGEPTLHPELKEIIRIAMQFAHQVFIETHGRWLLTNSPAREEILDAVKRPGVCVKISFDRMHQTSEAELKILTEKLSSRNIAWVVAITEINSEQFLKTRALCSWVLDAQIVFQQLVTSDDSLFKPEFGVIKANALRSSGLTSKATFQQTRTT